MSLFLNLLFEPDSCSNEYLLVLAKFGFDTAEKEPCKVCPLFAYRYYYYRYYYRSPRSLPIALALAILLDEPVKSVARMNASTAVLIGLSGLGCFALSITYMTLYKFSTPTSITVAANLNKVLTIIVAQSLFGGKLGQTQTVGLAICILASVWYSFATLQTSTKQK